MATRKQIQAAKRNVKKAQVAAKQRRTIANLPASTRRGLVEQAQRARRRGGRPGRALEDRIREEIFEIAKNKNFPGRSRIGKWDLIRAIRRAK
jgi:hypothetical protein